ncbi:ABC transporter substrate-binding protein [Arthrobacter sp. MDT1-48-3]
MKAKLWTRAGAIAIATGLALTACSGSGESSSGTPEQEGPQTLRLAQTSPPSNFQVGNWSGGDATLYLSTYDTIIGSSVQSELEPAVAESWEYNEDRTQLTLKIREGMTFSNGDPVDAAAVAASLEASRAGASTQQNLARIESVEAPDASTVLVTLSAPDAALVPTLSGPAGVVGDPDLLTSEDSKLTPVGSGPYVLADSTTVGSKYILEKNPDHWDAENYPYDTVEIQIIQDSAAAQNALQSGQLDFGGVPTEDALAQYPADRFTTGESSPGTVAALWLVDREGTIVPALKDVRVREAINLAVNREAIAENLNPGTNTPTNQLFSPLGEAYDEALLEQTPYDVERAKELLAEAGYADGFAVSMPSVAGITTTYESVIQQALADIGIEVTWESVPFQEFYARVLGGTYGMFFMFNGLSGSDARDLNTATSGVFNPFNQVTPEFQELAATVDSAPEDKQRDAIRAVNEYIVDEAWTAPVSIISGFYAHPNTVSYTPPVQPGQGVKPFQPAGSE